MKEPFICERLDDGTHAAFIIHNPTLDYIEHEIHTIDYIGTNGEMHHAIGNVDCSLSISGSKFKVLFGEELDEKFDPINRTSIMELMDRIDHRLAAGGING